MKLEPKRTKETINDMLINNKLPQTKNKFYTTRENKLSNSK